MGSDSQCEQLQEIWVAQLLTILEMYKRLKTYLLQFYKKAVKGQALFQDIFCCYLSGQLLSCSNSFMHFCVQPLHAIAICSNSNMKCVHNGLVQHAMINPTNPHTGQEKMVF